MRRHFGAATCHQHHDGVRCRGVVTVWLSRQTAILARPAAVSMAFAASPPLFMLGNKPGVADTTSNSADTEGSCPATCTPAVGLTRLHPSVSPLLLREVSRGAHGSTG